MKKLLILLVMLVAISANAQWQTDVRLTNDTAGSFTTFNNAWCVASSGSFVHVVWYDNRIGNDEIYYKRSTNGGLNWESDIRLTNNASSSQTPSIAVFGTNVHIVWEDNRDGNDEIYYKLSTNAGANWGADTRLTNNSADSWYPSIAVTGTVVHVVWKDNREFYDKIYYKRSTDGGLNWEADTRLTNTNAMSIYPSVAVSSSFVHVVWYDNRDGNDEIYYKRSTDGGLSWGTDIRLTNNTAYSITPSIGVSGSFVYIVWPDIRDGNYEIYYKRSTDSGINWEADTRLTNSAGSSYFSSTAISGSDIHVVWRDTRDGNDEIYYKRSTNAGANWEEDTRLTNNTATSYNPSVAISGSVVHVVWYDNRDSNYEIYYKRNPTGNVGIQNINTEMPSKYSLSQNYPNPFNPTTNMKFSIVNTGEVKLVVYDIQGREVRTLVNEFLKPGTYEAAFDGSVLNSGVYFYKLITGTFTETKKMLLIK
ncbi:MAG: T9SS type A sorting domain-containing protein [Ignavibacteria bacterium]